MKVRLGEICDVFSGFAFKSFNEIQKGNPVIKIGNIRLDGKISNESCVYSEERPDKKYYSKVNDIYIALSGATTGKVGIMDKSDFLINQRVGVVRLKDKKIPVKYLYAFLQSKSIKILRDAFGAAQPNISPRDILNYEINVGQNYEMEKIANRLDKISELIEKRRLQIEKLDLLIKSKFIEMFGAINRPKYPLQSIGDLCEFLKDGTHQTPSYTDDKNKGYKFLSSKDVTSGVIDWSDIKYIPAELHNELYSRISPRRNDILLAKNGTTGIAALVDTDEIFDIYVSLALLRFKEGVNIKYILYAINSKGTKKQFDESLKGIGVPNLHLSEIKKTKLIIPPIELQNEFAEFVEKVEKIKQTINQSLKKLETLKKALMQKYFG